jgi:hypothetical protein
MCTEVIWEVVGEIRYFVKLPLESLFGSLTMQRPNRLQDNIIRSDDKNPSYVRISTRQGYIKLMRDYTRCYCDETASLEGFGSKGSPDRDTRSLREPTQNYLRGINAVGGRNLVVDKLEIPVGSLLVEPTPTTFRGMRLTGLRDNNNGSVVTRRGPVTGERGCCLTAHAMQGHEKRS